MEEALGGVLTTVVLGAEAFLVEVWAVWVADGTTETAPEGPALLGVPAIVPAVPSGMRGVGPGMG